MRIFQPSTRKWFLVILFFFSALILLGINLMQNTTQSYDDRENKYIEASALTSVQYRPDYAMLYGKKLNKMKIAYEELRSTQAYYEIWNQFLYIENCTYGEKFLQWYEEGHSQDSIYMLKTEEGVKPLHAIKTVQLSDNCMDLFQMDLLNGRLLGRGDMDYIEGTTVPVLLGSEYLEILEIGDVFQGSYLLKDFDFEVVGFLKSGSNIATNNNLVYLDRMIVMPFLNFGTASNSDEDTFQVRHYSSKLTGYFPMDALPAIRARLGAIHSLGIGTLSISGEVPLGGIYAQIIQTVGVSTQSLEVLLTVIALILCPVLFFVFQRSNYDLYGTLFLLGTPMRTLRFSIWLQFVAVMVAALGSVFLCGLLSQTIFYMQTLVIAVAMMILVAGQLLFLSSKSMILWMGSGKHVKIESHF